MFQFMIQLRFLDAMPFIHFEKRLTLFNNFSLFILIFIQNNVAFNLFLETVASLGDFFSVEY